MRNVLCVFFLTFSFISLFGQAPINDECTNAIDLGSTPSCDTSIIYDNVEATASDIGRNNLPPCFQGVSNSDVWFTFTTTDAPQYDFLVKGVEDATATPPDAMSSIEVAIYGGVCDTNMLEFTGVCFSGTNGSLQAKFSTAALMPNTTYFVRVNSRGPAGSRNGNFIICIDEKQSDITVAEELSVLCSGTLTDTGVDTAYGNNEDHIFTICPDSSENCLILTMGAYELETKPGGGGDYFIIYDGSDTTGTIIGSSRDLRDTTNKSTFSGIDNSVCQVFQAQSGCMTLRWHTDSSVVAEGFSATWRCSLDSCDTFDTLSVTVAPTDDEIINLIQGRLLTIDAIDRMCADTAHGIYDSDGTDFGMASGLLLTTGRADSVARPNTVPDFGWNNDTVGIPLLDSLSKRYGDTTLTHDGCAIELDFTPETDVIMLEFSMGSEEYSECLMDQQTDLLGLFYTTMGFNGDADLDNYQNIARLFDNSGMPRDIQVSNMSPQDSIFWIYYSNNTRSQSLEYDGILSNGGIDGAAEQKFVMIQSNAEPCQTNMLLAAIADRGDSLYDSGIMITNIRCLTPSIGFQTSTGAPFLIEECNPGDDFLTFEFPRIYDNDTQWKVTFGGDATQGLDYTWNHGDMITLPAGQQSVRYDIDVVDDGFDEDTETIEIKLTRDWGCGEVELSELTIAIRDRLVIEIDGPPTACFNEALNLPVTGDLEFFEISVLPSDISYDPNTTSVNFNAVDDIQVVITGVFNHLLGSCEWSDTLDIIVVNPQVSLEPNMGGGICLGESLTFSALLNGDAANRTWSPTNLLDNPNGDTVVFTPDGFYPGYRLTVKVDTLGCADSASVVIGVDTLGELDLIPDTIICQGESINLVNSPIPSYNYSWSPNGSLDDASSENPLAAPSTTTTYTVNYTSMRGFCSDVDQVTVEVLEVGEISLTTPEVACSGDFVTIREIGLPDSIKNNFTVTYTWELGPGGNEIDGADNLDSVRVKVNGSGSVTLIANIQGCERRATVPVNISTPGRFIWELMPDSFIVNCANVQGVVSFSAGNAAVDLSTVEWEFDRDENDDDINEEVFSTGSLSFERETNQSGFFRITFRDENGCLHKDQREVEVVTPGAIIPNTFTPDGDQLNDVFKIGFEEDGLEYEVKRFQIISRWGDIVFDDNTNDGWDGTINGEDAISDVYLYSIQLIDQCGNPVQELNSGSMGPNGGRQKLQGDVTLVR